MKAINYFTATVKIEWNNNDYIHKKKKTEFLIANLYAVRGNNFLYAVRLLFKLKSSRSAAWLFVMNNVD